MKPSERILQIARELRKENPGIVWSNPTNALSLKVEAMEKFLDEAFLDSPEGEKDEY